MRCELVSRNIYFFPGPDTARIVSRARARASERVRTTRAAASKAEGTSIQKPISNRDNNREIAPWRRQAVKMYPAVIVNDRDCLSLLPLRRLPFPNDPDLSIDSALVHTRLAKSFLLGFASAVSEIRSTKNLESHKRISRNLSRKSN